MQHDSDANPRENPSPSAGLEELLAQLPFLQRLAGALVRDEHLAEDLVQDGWVLALEKPPRAEALGAWFRAVLRNRARNTARDRARREARETETARAEALPPIDAAQEKLETQRRLTELVADLGEPYRTALFLRYYEDLSPTRIAAHLGVPVKTVKTRLARGLDELRRRMDAHHDGGRGRWLAALAPLTPRPATGALASTLGGLLMKKTVLAVIVLLLVGAGLTRMILRSERATPAASVAAAPPPILLELAPKGDTAPRSGRAASRLLGREPAPPPEPEADLTTGALEITVRWSDGTRAAGVGLQAKFEEGGLSRERFVFARSGEQGLLRFEGLPAGSVTLYSDRNRQRLDADVIGGESRSLEFTLGPGLEVVGRVVDLEERGVSGAEIWGEGTRFRWPTGRLLARAAADGSFRLRAMAADSRIGARAIGYQPSCLFDPGEHPELSAGVRSLTLVMGSPGGRLAGRVLSPEGEPLEGVQVLAGERGEHMVDDPAGIPGTVARPVIVQTDQDGEFVYPGDLAPGRTPVHALTPGLPAWSGTVEIGAGEHYLEIRLDEPGRIAGRLLTAGGEPVAGGTVMAAVMVRGGWYHYQQPPPRAETDESGHFELKGVCPGVRELNASGPRGSREGRAQVRVPCAAGETTTIELVLDPGPLISGRVVDLQGDPVPNWGVHGQPTANWYSRQDRTDEQGRFVLTNVAEGRHRLHLGPVGEYHSPGTTLLDVAAGTTGLEIVVDTANAPKAFVHGTLLDIESGSLADARILIRREGERSASFVEFDPADGSFAHGPIQPGTYALELFRRGRTVFTSASFTLTANEDRDLGLIQVGKPGSVAIVVAGIPGGDLSELRPKLNRSGLSTIDTKFEDGGFHASEVAPGTWVLSSRHSPWFLPDRIVEVRAGETARVTWKAERVAVELRAACVFEEGERGWSTLRVEVRDTAGELVWLEPGIMAWRLKADRIRLPELLLPEGRFTIEARTDTGLGAVDSYTVDRAAPLGRELELIMR